MGILTKEEFNSFDDLFVHELKDLYDEEHQLTQALPRMADKATNPELKKAFQSHLQQTEKHVQRLESILEHRGIEPDRETCSAMAGLIKEGSVVLDAEGDRDVLDAALIGAAQRVEHYEIAAYGTAKCFAQHLADDYAAELLGQTLDEEKTTDEKLTKIAEEAVNPASVGAKT